MIKEPAKTNKMRSTERKQAFSIENASLINFYKLSDILF